MQKRISFLFSKFENENCKDGSNVLNWTRTELGHGEALPCADTPKRPDIYYINHARTGITKQYLSLAGRN